MDCKTAAPLLDLYLDGELDRDDARALEAHVDGCESCRAELAARGRLRHAIRTQAPRHAAPDALRRRIEQSAATARAPAPRRRGFGQWRLAAAVFAAFIAGAAIMRVAAPPSSGDRQQLTRDLFASHWRALAATSPVDVVSSDRHTVKPWFAGKLAQAPVVHDFAEQGFPLVGGRIDYAGTDRIPVLVYRHGRHLIDVFVLPATHDFALGGETRLRGYSLIVGTLGDQKAAVVSDLDEHELARFRELLGGTR